MDVEKMKNGNVPSRNNEKKREVSVDEVITLVGEYGRFQIVVNAILCFMALPPVFQIMIMYFAADKSEWRCKVNNNSSCTFNGTFPYDHNKDPRTPNKCSFDRKDWEFVQAPNYSLVTTFDIYCGNEWVIEMVTSIFFVGWIIGSVILGWFSDNYGRKPVLFVSMAVIMVTAFISPFLPNVYLLIFCRLIIGTFIPGTYQQGIMIMTESVGPKFRAFAGNIIFVFVTSSMAIVGLKAYFIRDWKTLHIICSVPYLVTLLFYKFIPESLRILSIKGRTKELMSTLHRMAKFNNQELPSDIVVVSESAATEHHSNPLDLFRSRKLARKTLFQVLGYIVGGVTFYGLYLAAKDIGGSLHRDYEIVTLVEIPFALSAIPLCDNFGRKKTCIMFYIIGTLACVGLCVVPEGGSIQILRVLLGMLGKCSVGAGYNTLQTWTIELYPTYIRGEAFGFLQVLTRIGAALAPFADTELMKLSHLAPFIFFGAVTFASIFFLTPLKETRGETLGEANKDAEEEEEAVVEMKMGEEVSVSIYANGAVNELYDTFEKTEEHAGQIEEHDEKSCTDVVEEHYEKPHTIGVTNELYDMLNQTEESVNKFDESG